MKLLYQSIARTGAHELLWSVDRGRLRILCYHGVCEDRLAAEPWMPDFFVSAKMFEQQLAYLAAHARVLPLAEAVARLKDGTLPARSVALTFDDGYANNVELAAPLLNRFGMHATVFLSTRYMETGEIFPFLQTKLIRLTLPGARVPAYKTLPVDAVLSELGPLWRRVRLTADQQRTLRPLTVDEVRAGSPALGFGAHTDSHCILSNETPERRRTEILGSIEKACAWGGMRLFSYPNGQIGDFNEQDKQALREAGVDVAVSGIAGANRASADALELRRYPVGLHHADEARFAAEVTGCRTTLRAVAGAFGA